MNSAAEQHLARALRHLIKGDEFYGKCADEIIAAQKADPTLGYREIGAWFDRGKDWARRLVAWRTSGSPESVVDWERGSHGTKSEIEDGALKLLAEAPAEQIERIIAELPKERQQIVGAAAGNRFLQARQEVEEQARNRTPQERRQIEGDHRRAMRPLDQALATMGVQLLVIPALEQALEDLRQLQADGGLTPEALEQIDAALEAFVAEFTFTKRLAGMEA